jgi:hypothetical protein
MRRAAWASRKKEWRIRARLVFETFAELCGASGKDLLVQTPGKAVRADYLRRAIAELTRDKSTRDAFFHRGVPVNVERWVRAICTHDIATYVPHDWVRRRDRKRTKEAPALEAGPVFARIRVNGDVEGCDLFVDSFVGEARALGVEVRVADDVASPPEGEGERLFAAGGERHAEGRDHERELRRGDSFESCSSAFSFREDASVLDVEEFNGLLERNGKVVVSGGTDWWAGVGVEPAGGLLRSYDAKDDRARLPFDPFVVARESNVWGGLWTVVGVRGDPLALETMRGIAIDVVAHAQTTGGARELAKNAARTVSEAERAKMELNGTRDLRARRRETTTRCDIARLLALVVKRKREPWVCRALADAPSDPDPEPPVGETSATRREAPRDANLPTVLPTRCRNAWVLEDGTVLETRDATVARTVVEKRAWTKGPKCSACPPEHPDPLVATRTACPSSTCRRAFRVFSTTTHWGFKNARGKRVELDMNAPLFTDEALAMLL